MRRLTLIITLMCFAFAANAERLPRTVFPVHYTLSFEPDFQTDRFQGEETIDISIQQPTREIVLNAAEMEIKNVIVEGGGSSHKASVRLDEKRETATLTVPTKLPIGPARIRLSYTGNLNDKLRGFYRGTLNGRKYAATQMESTDARRAFPSFDEPAMKATFDVTLVLDQKDAGFSNGALLSETAGPKPGKKTLRFATTPRMSTYLVAMVVGDFKCLEGESESIPLRVCSSSDRFAKGQFALDASKHFLRYFNGYYGIRYPFGKLDQIGLADFAAGAMENTGLITYRDRYLLVDEGTTASTKKGIAETVAHEIAHMWFGDLVTMEWWDDIWLNEGFATWMEQKATDLWKPEWKIRLESTANVRYPMSTDGLAATRKIRQQASTPDEIDELFDGIAYAKTAAVLSMLESYVGEEEFRKGINTYFDRHAWSNTTFFDFADAISACSSKPVDRILASFVQQPGVPLVGVEARCEGNQSVITLSQQRFRFEKEAGGVSGQVWAIPVCVKNGNGEQCVLLDEPRQTFRMAGCDGTLLANRGGRGYYLSSYDPKLAERLRRGASSLAPEERVTLLRDEWMQVRSGDRSVADFLSLAESFGKERERIILDVLFENLLETRRTLVVAEDLSRYEAWVRKILQPIAREIGWIPAQNETDDRRQLRSALLNALAYTGNDPEALKVARGVSDDYLRDRKSVDPNLAAKALPLAALTGDARLYDNYLSAWRSAKSDQEKAIFLNALPEFPDRALLDRTLRLAVSGEVRNQDSTRLLVSTFYNPRHGRRGWEFVRSESGAVEKAVPPRGLQSVLGGNRAFCDGVAAAELRAFIQGRPELMGSRSVKQTLEKIDQCSRLRALQAPRLSAYLRR